MVVTDSLQFIMAKKTGEETGHLHYEASVDLDIGDTNDFEIHIPKNKWNIDELGYECLVFMTDTEYGGIINDIQSVNGEVVLRGNTWRGLLKYKIVEPPAGQDHLIVDGDLNDVIRDLLSDRFENLYNVPDIKTGIIVNGWQVDRFVTLYDAIMKLLENYDYKLQLNYIEPESLEYGYVNIQAVPVVDYSDSREFSIDGQVDIDIRDYRGGINHLVCIGEGQNQERLVLHLYVQSDGTIGKTQFYTGKKEYAAVYNYSSANEEELEENGREKLQTLQNYKKCGMDVDEIDLELGDIVSGYDDVTETQVKKPITQKIIKVKDGEVTIECNIKGED